MYAVPGLFIGPLDMYNSATGNLHTMPKKVIVSNQTLIV